MEGEEDGAVDTEGELEGVRVGLLVGLDVGGKVPMISYHHNHMLITFIDR